MEGAERLLSTLGRLICLLFHSCELRESLLTTRVGEWDRLTEGRGSIMSLIKADPAETPEDGKDPAGKSSLDNPSSPKEQIPAASATEMPNSEIGSVGKEDGGNGGILRCFININISKVLLINVIKNRYESACIYLWTYLHYRR
jgi:hypothetical protein